MLWDTTAEGRDGHDVRQVWFKGSHGDVGGQLNGRATVRPRSNISLRWMLEEAAQHGLALPDGWQGRFPTNPNAPTVGTFGGFGKLFWVRRRRVVGVDPSEELHDTAKAWAEARGVQLLPPEPEGRDVVPG